MTDNTTTVDFLDIAKRLQTERNAVESSLDTAKETIVELEASLEEANKTNENLEALLEVARTNLDHEKKMSDSLIESYKSKDETMEKKDEDILEKKALIESMKEDRTALCIRIAKLKDENTRLRNTLSIIAGNASSALNTGKKRKRTSIVEEKIPFRKLVKKRKRTLRKVDLKGKKKKSEKSNYVEDPEEYKKTWMNDRVAPVFNVPLLKAIDERHGGLRFGNLLNSKGMNHTEFDRELACRACDLLGLHEYKTVLKMSKEKKKSEENKPDTGTVGGSGVRGWVDRSGHISKYIPPPGRGVKFHALWFIEAMINTIKEVGFDTIAKLKEEFPTPPPPPPEEEGPAPPDEDSSSDEEESSSTEDSFIDDEEEESSVEEEEDSFIVEPSVEEEELSIEVEEDPSIEEEEPPAEAPSNIEDDSTPMEEEERECTKPVEDPLTPPTHFVERQTPDVPGFFTYRPSPSPVPHTRVGYDDRSQVSIDRLLYNGRTQSPTLIFRDRYAFNLASSKMPQTWLMDIPKLPITFTGLLNYTISKGYTEETARTLIERMWNDYTAAK
jgi:hypothetical protein